MNYEGVNDFELIYKIRENDDEVATYDLVKKYEPIIVEYAKKYYFVNPYYGVDLNDFVQEGRLAVFKALKSFDLDGDVLFYTYVNLCIKRSMISYCRRLGTAKNYVLNSCLCDDAYLFVGDMKYSPEIFSDYIYCDGIILDYMNTLDFLDSNIFELRYNGFSYTEISELLDVSVTTVSRHLCKIKNTLHKIKGKL